MCIYINIVVLLFASVAAGCTVYVRPPTTTNSTDTNCGSTSSLPCGTIDDAFKRASDLGCTTIELLASNTSFSCPTTAIPDSVETIQGAGSTLSVLDCQHARPAFPPLNQHSLSFLRIGITNASSTVAGGVLNLRCDTPTCRVTVTDCTFTHISSSLTGGVFAFYGIIDATFERTQFRFNRAPAGSAIYLESSPGFRAASLDVESTVFESNSGTPVLTHCDKSSSCLPLHLYFENSQFIDNYASNTSTGGAISLFWGSPAGDNSLEVQNCTFRGNFAGAGAGLAVNLAGSGDQGSAWLISCTDSEFERNNATTGGGAAMFIDHNASISFNHNGGLTANLKNCRFSGNEAKFGAGLVFNGQSFSGLVVDIDKLKLENCTFTDDVASESLAAEFLLQGHAQYTLTNVDIYSSKQSNLIFLQGPAFLDLNALKVNSVAESIPSYLIFLEDVDLHVSSATKITSLAAGSIVQLTQSYLTDGNQVPIVDEPGVSKVFDNTIQCPDGSSVIVNPFSLLNIAR